MLLAGGGVCASGGGGVGRGGCGGGGGGVDVGGLGEDGGYGVLIMVVVLGIVCFGVRVRG